MLRVSESQYFILGPEVKALEAACAAYSGCKFGIGMSSGTDALLIALMALDIGAGDEVITSPYTFFATAGTIARVGARPVFVDIEPDTSTSRRAAIEAFIATRARSRDGELVNRATGGRVRALMPVHLYGQMADMTRIMQIAQRHGLRVIEDAAQAIGSADAQGRRAGSIGDIGCLSFFPTKNLGAFGDAGMCVTNDAALAAEARDPACARRQAQVLPQGHRRQLPPRRDPGRGAEREAAAPRRLERGAAAQRGVLRCRFRARRGSAIAIRTPPKAPAGARHIYNQYCIRAQRRDELRKWLGDSEVGTEIYYPLSLHMQECFAYLGHKPEDFPESLRASNESLALPIYPELVQSQLQYVVDCIKAFFKT